MLKDKGKAVPLQAWTSPEGSRKLRFPDFVTTAQNGGRLSALRTGRLYPKEILPVLISVRGWGPYCDRKDFMSMKNPLTPAGIEPATYRFVAQHLNPSRLYLQEILPVLISVRGWVDPRAIMRSEGFYVNEKFQWHQLGSKQWPTNL